MIKDLIEREKKFEEAIVDFPLDDMTRNSILWVHTQAMQKAYEAGREEERNKVVDYICSQSEEAVPGLFYVTSKTLDEARYTTPDRPLNNERE